MKKRFEETKRRFNNIFQETRKSCEDILLEILNTDEGYGYILEDGGVTVNSPNYDNEWDDAFCLIDSVKLEDSINSNEKVVVLKDTEKGYELGINDVTIEQLLLITQMVVNNFNNNKKNQENIW